MAVFQQDPALSPVSPDGALRAHRRDVLLELRR